MKSFTEVVEAQGVSGQQIQQIIKNYKKDGASRKCTTEYFHRYIQRLNSCWIEFERNDNQLRQHKDIDQSHQYFTSDYYSEVKQLVEQYLEEFQQKLDLLEEKEHRSQALPMHEARKQTVQEIPMQEAREQNGHAGLIRRIKASIDSLKRTAYELDHDTSGQPVQYFKVKLRFINDLWQRVEELQQEIWEKLENPTASGFDIDEYNQISDVVQQQKINLSIKLDQIESSNNVNQPALQECHGQTSLPLPKVTIPQFSGDYLKWRQFYELFSQMIDNQPIPAVQKMWYLKANVSGEAAKLINHFSLTADDYHSAWTLLQDRYNNKRVLVAALVDKLLNQPSGAATAASIKGLHDTTKECVLALNNLGVDTASWDPLLLHLLIKKIDRSTHMRFEQSITNPKELLKIDEFLRFLENQFQTIEAIGQKEKISASLHAGRTVSSVVTLDKNKGNCQKCSNGNHPLYRCKQFLELSPSDRLNWVKHQGVCYNCFKGDHVAQKCNSRSCQKCNKKHNTLLHLEIKNQSRSVSDGQSGPSNEITTATSAAANTVAFNSGQILLATAKIQIKASNGNSGEFRAILDSGSQINIVSERLIKRLSIHPTEASLCIDGIGNAQRKTTQRVNLKMCSMTTSFESHLEAFVLPTIIPAQPNHSIDVSKWSIPNIQLADPEFHKQGKIDVLLGAEFYLKLLIAGQIKLAPNLPILQNSSLGWIISGKIGVNQNLTPSDSLTCAVFGLKTDNSDDPLVEVIEKMWKMDDIETNKKGLSPSEQCCEAHFAQNVRLNNEGRFIVRLPFLEHTTVLGESRELAYNRFMGLERRLLKNVEVRQQYRKFMEEFEALGHMTEISIESVMTPSYFIPHHAVLKPDSSTTKLRVVFDASAKTTSGYSLNDLMYTGPTVQDELFSILIRFRLPRFVFTTDIEKMYRQIIIHPDDRRYQIIMWRKDPASSIRYYQLNTVTYGTRAAPYLATKCLQQIASENIIKYPLGAKLLKNDFYVDDGLGGSDKLATAIETQQQLIHILKKHGFNLRKWCANHPQLLQHIPQGDQEVNLDFDNSSNESVKTLGLIWLPKTDRLCIKVRLNTVDRITKRTVSSDLAKLFDPLGLLAPVVVRAKIFIQKLWQLKLSWDEPLPSNYKETWITFRESLSNLDNLQVSRHIYYGETPVSSQLHVFADASEKAFGAAAYIRATLQDGRVMVRLLCSKTRVAPLKTQTLPRLELCAALIAAQLANRIKNDLKLSDQPIVLWTDSEIVLSWINAQSSSFQTFVANRIAKIQTLSIPEQWRHVKSQFNPADLLSRGLSTKDLALSALWFQGPMFLHGGQESWPPIFSPALEIQNNMERKKESAVVIPTTINDRNFVYQIQHKNSFAKLQRIIAYVLRFIRNTKRSTKSRPKQISPNADELTEALNVIMKAIQAADFAKDIKCLKKQHVVDKSSSISSLSPFIDDKGIIRVGGRLEAASIPYGTKHPMLIPYNDPLAKLLFIMVHEQNMHCGPQALLGILRQRFWPIKGKCTARSTVQGCIRCNKAQPKLYEQIMGNLPKERVTPARPFITAGVDYCGPFSIHYKIRGKRATKAYIALFCCFVTKAIHLELVSDLSTDGFIGALKRFISRRGRCQNIYSDNATNFVGARNKLAELNQAIYSDESKEKIITTCSARGINFHFIPPRAPHFGGLWEAAVKSAKRLLLRTCETAALTYEELETVIIEAEAILNSRPLTPISNDPDDFTALTPGHFLIGEALTSQIDNRGEQGKRTLLSRWKLVSAIKYEFWQQWSSNYLTSLQERHKWKQNAADIKEGSLVIIKEDNVPVMHWPLGRIVRIHKGPDAVTRVVDVKTATGIFKRPVHRLALLPVEADEQEKTSNAVEGHHDNEKQRIEPTTKKRKIQDAENVPTMTPKADLPKHKDQPEEALDLQQFKINI